MDVHKYTLLLNDCLKGHMLSLSRREKKRLREKFEFLEAGIWDSGVQVKKLKGISGKVIFEARLSKGDRILFTLGKQGRQTTICIWGLVKHDDIRKAAQNIFPENAPFLSFEPETREEYPEILIDELPEEYFSQEAIEEKSPEDYGPQKWLVLSDEEWKRVLLAADAENFEIFLFLTSEQSRVLETDPPILLSGTAGSGKTTISVYYLLKKNFMDKKRLFLTYSPYLNEFSQRIYSGLVSQTGLEDSNMMPDFYVFRDLLRDLAMTSGLAFDETKEVGLREFEGIFRNHKLHQKYDAELVWEEIRSIIKGAKPPINLERYRKLSRAYIQGDLSRNDLNELKDYLLGLKNFEFMDKIERILERKTRYSRFDDLVQGMSLDNGPSSDDHRFALGEILKTIEKKAKSFSTPLLTYQEYLNLGKKRAPNFLYERREIYGIAEYYQGKLEEQGQWDEIDLCRQAIQHMGRRQMTRFRYDLVVCDEVQDFADIQLSLIFRLAKSHRGIVLTGDPKQIINPSGFRWEEAKNRFYERGVEIPDVYKLNLNFRCVGNIVKLSNALLDLKQQLVGLSGSELREDWKFNGRPPFLLTGMPEKEILDRLHLKGAGQIVLVRNKDDQRKLKKRLQTELIFTISEAKGLEFDTVFLWKFVSDKKSADIWRRIKEGNYFDRSHYPHIKHEINLLYVAITRARNTLLIFESSRNVWDLPVFHDLLYRIREKGVLSEVWQRISTPEEWEKQGDYFFEREYYPAAAECYKNAGNIHRTEIANAFAFEKNKKFKVAAELLEKYDYPQKAAECYEHAGLFSDALKLWEKLKDGGRLRTCRINLYEQNGEYNKAANEWYKLKDFSRALEDWKKAGNHQKVAEYYYTNKQYGKAAEEFEMAHAYDRAASCYKKAKQLDKAADLLYESGNFTEAIPLYRKLKNHDRLLSCYINNKDPYNAALLCEKNNEVAKAITFFAEFAKASPENRNILSEEAKKQNTRGSKIKLGIRLSALEMHEQSAPIFFEKGYYDIALNHFKKTKSHEKVAACYIKLQDYYQAALEYEKTDRPDKWTTVTSLLEQYLDLYSESAASREDKLFKEAESFFRRRQYDKAVVRYRAIYYPEKVYDSYLNLDRHEEALGFFLDHDLHNYAIKYLDDKKDVTVSSDFVGAVISDYHENAGWYLREHKDMDFIARLLGTVLSKDDGQETMDMVNQFLSSLYYFTVDDDFPKSVLDLMLQAKHYNAILGIFKCRAFKKPPVPDILKSFKRDVKRKAKQEKDKSLVACHLFRDDRVGFESTVGEVSITEWNYKLFAESTQQYPKAVDYLVQKNKIYDATIVCRQHQNYRLAAQVYENAGDYLSAAKHYREGKCYEDAVRCYKKVGDESGVARVYERMKEFDRAISIWKKLGKMREVKRVLKKKEKQLENKRQLRLF